MKKIVSIIAFLVLGFSGALGQSFTTITATSFAVDNGSGGSVFPASGSNFCLQGVNSLGAAITYTPSGGSPVTGPVCNTMDGSGNIVGSMTVANPSTASPAGLRYTLTITNGGTTYITIPKIQLSGTLFQFATYNLPVNGMALGIGSPHIGCNSGALYTSTTYPSGQNAFTCTLVAGMGQWKTYPTGGTYCPAGQSYQTPQVTGNAFCLSPVISGIGTPTGSCIQNSIYLQQDDPGTAYACVSGGWVLLSVRGGGGGTLTSFQGRTTPAATLQAGDFEGILANAPNSFSGTRGILFDSGTGQATPASTWSIGTGALSGQLVGSADFGLFNGSTQEAFISHNTGNVFFAAGAFTINGSGSTTWGGGPFISSTALICQSTGTNCPAGVAPQYQTVQNTSTTFTQRGKTKFDTTVGFAITDNSGNGSTDVSLSGIPNSALANPTFTINCTGGCTGGGTIALGGSTTLNVSGGGGTPASPAFAVQFANSSVTANQADPFVTIDPTVHALLARISQATAYTDLYVSGGGNNGVTNFLASSDCTNAACNGLIGSTSTDTESGFPYATTSGNTSSMIEDRRLNAAGLYINNPGVNNIPITLNWQVGRNDIVQFTQQAPGPVLGASQIGYNQYYTWTAPGYSLGEQGTLPAGYTSMSDWAEFVGQNNISTMYGSGIHQISGSIFNVTAGEGDITKNYDYMKVSGTCTAPSDECAKHNGVNMSTVPDVIGTIGTITNPEHYHLNISSEAGFQGQDRLIVDTTQAYAVLTPLDGATAPTSDGLTPGSATLNEVTFPVSTGRAHTTAPCDVPVQTSGVVPNVNCTFVVDFGTFGVTGTSTCGTMGTSLCGIGSEASPTENLSNLGIQITGATALSGGNQTLTMTLHRKIPAGAFICQGGMASSAIELVADSQDFASDAQPISGQVIPVFCSPDAHTLWYAYPNSSQIWSGLIVGNSQQRTTGIATQVYGGGSFHVNLTRTSNIVTGVITDGNTTGYQLTLDSARFWSIQGCSDATMNVTANPTQLSIDGNLDPTGNTIYYPQTGANSTCTGAKLVPQQTNVSVYPAAKIYNVQNTTTGQIDGTIAASYQPMFTSGDAFKIPTGASASFAVDFVEQNIGQPSFGSLSYSVKLDQYSALGTTAYAANVTAVPNQVIGGGGNVFGPTLLGSNGVFHYGLSMGLAPDPLGAVINIGFTSNNCQNAYGGQSCPAFENFAVISMEGGSVQYRYNEVNSTFQQTIGGIVEMQSPSQTLFNNTTSMQTAQFGGFNLGPTNIGMALQQLRYMHGIGGSSPMSWDNVLAEPVVKALTTGSTTYIYVIIANYPHGATETGVTFIFNGAATPNNTIDCGVLPSGMSGTVYKFINPLLYPVNATGNCTSPSTIVADTGTYGSPISSSYPTFGADFFSGGFVASSLGGYFFAPTGTGTYTAPSAGITQTTNGIINFGNGTVGDHTAEILMGAFGIAGSQIFTGVQGTTGTNFAAALGSFTTNHIRITNSTGDEIDSGVAGFTGTCTLLSITNITVSNGIITGCS